MLSKISRQLRFLFRVCVRLYYDISPANHYLSAQTHTHGQPSEKMTRTENLRLSRVNKILFFFPFTICICALITHRGNCVLATRLESLPCCYFTLYCGSYLRAVGLGAIISIIITDKQQQLARGE